MRSERAFCERLNYDLLFKWFLDLRIDDPAFDASTFSKNRRRLLDHDVADVFFAAVVRQAKLRRYTSRHTSHPRPPPGTPTPRRKHEASHSERVTDPSRVPEPPRVACSAGWWVHAAVIASLC